MSQIRVYDDNGDIITIPARWEICGSCRGEGESSRYLGAFTADDMHDLGDDFREDYVTGRYDRTCDECGGSGKVREIDLNRATPEQVSAYGRDMDALAELRAMEASERRMGC